MLPIIILIEVHTKIAHGYEYFVLYTNPFHITGPLWGKIPGHRWIPLINDK